MKKKLMVVLMVVCMLVLVFPNISRALDDDLTASFTYPSLGGVEEEESNETTPVIFSEVIKDLSSKMKQMTDLSNKGWSKELIVNLNGQILENAGNPPKAAFIAQILELLHSDAYYCATGRNQQNMVTGEINKYKNIKMEMIAATPRENFKDLMSLLNAQRNYYLKTKTRASGFGNSCEKKVLSHR